jgi:hypothetical protein
MNPRPRDGSAPAQEISDLLRLIEAIDHRLARLERVAEARIARDASNLREHTATLRQQIE